MSSDQIGLQQQPFEEVLDNIDPEFRDAIGAFEKVIFKGPDRVLSEKVSRLVHLACSCARGGPLTYNDIRRAFAAGASEQEVIEAIEISILTFGGQAVRHGIDALNDILDES